jgi:hypothetical protein
VVFWPHSLDRLHQTYAFCKTTTQQQQASRIGGTFRGLNKRLMLAHRMLQGCDRASTA